MKQLDASAVARLLVEYGQRLALRGGNPYRARAYATAAENLMALTVPLAVVVSQNRLREIPGVGPAIAEVIAALHWTGTHPTLEAMRRDVPASVLDMMSIPGLQPDKIARIYDELGIATIEELQHAASTGQLAGVKGLGAALERKILQGLKVRQTSHGRRHVHRARELLAKAEANLMRSHPGLTRVTMAGDFRRGCELVSDLRLVAEGDEPAEWRLNDDIAVHVATPDRYGAALMFATGSAAHLDALKARATAKGLTLALGGLGKGARIIASRTEADIYAALDLQFIPPDLREGRDEIARAEAGDIPVLVADEDIRGILHAHTNRSDGVHTLEQMAEAARGRGYGYFGVADHSQSAAYAGGLKLPQLEQQHREVERLNTRYGGAFRVFTGIEADILADGTLDYPDDVLARFDFVVASVHSHFRVDEETQTKRILRAIVNPYTTILGHPTGR